MSATATATESPELLADQWNAEFPDGTPVVVLIGETKAKTTTRGQALVINGTPYITLQGVKGAVPLERVTVSPYRRWVKINRRGLKSHWIEAEFESREAMENQIAEMKRLDRRIEYFETSATRPLDA